MEIKLSNSLIALHGFLGLPEDWHFFNGKFAANYLLESRDLWQDSRALEPLTITSWTHQFITEIAERQCQPVLLGYSMGGRLALHALQMRPDLFRAAIIVSAHPGLRDEHEKQERLAKDEMWSERWEHESWNSVLKAWNEQSVLRSHPDLSGQDPGLSLERIEGAFDRKSLARVMSGWSLAHQADLREAVSKLSLPLLYIAGSEDTKFRALLDGLSLGERSQKKIIQGAGHRTPWDRPKAFSKAVSEFLASLPD